MLLTSSWNTRPIIAVTKSRRNRNTSSTTNWKIGILVCHALRNEPPHDKTNKMPCVPSEDSDQPGHPPSLIRDFAVHMKKACVLGYPLSALRRLSSDWADAQADLSLRWAQSFCWFCHEVAQICFVWFVVLGPQTPVNNYGHFNTVS